MPQTTPERRARWEDDSAAIFYLESRGLKLRRDWCWDIPRPDFEFSEKDKDAIIYLIEEWDFGPAIEEKA